MVPLLYEQAETLLSHRSEVKGVERSMLSTPSSLLQPDWKEPSKGEISYDYDDE
jgi:hypothetical protein